MKKKKCCSFCFKDEDGVDLLVSTPAGSRPKAYICELCVDMCVSIHKRHLINRTTELEAMVDAIVKAVNAAPPPEPQPTATVQPQATAERT